MATNKGSATPLCLPNNCQWNEYTCEYSHSSEQRNSLYVVDKALDQLRKIKGMSVSDKIKGLHNPRYHRLKVSGTSDANYNVPWPLPLYLLETVSVIWVGKTERTIREIVGTTHNELHFF